jgi:hypothetical protein
VKTILFPRELTILVISSYIDKCKWITEIGNGDGTQDDFGALGEAAFAAAGELRLAPSEETTVRTESTKEATVRTESTAEEPNEFPWCIRSVVQRLERHHGCISVLRERRKNGE